MEFVRAVKTANLVACQHSIPDGERRAAGGNRSRPERVRAPVEQICGLKTRGPWASYLLIRHAVDSQAWLSYPQLWVKSRA
jgi:hypothetical protein